MLTFDPELHRYTVDGRELPSVTQVLEDVGIVDYSRIPRDTREAAMARGTRVHIATAFDDEFTFGFNPAPLDESTVSDEDMGYVEAWRRFRAEKRFRADLIEHRSYHPQYWYAGTLDRTGVFESSPHFRVCVDLKSGTAEPWVQIQTAAYSAFFDHPRTYLRMCVELHSDATYRVYTFHAKDWQRDFNRFLWALETFRTKRDLRWAA